MTVSFPGVFVAWKYSPNKSLAPAIPIKCSVRPTTVLFTHTPIVELLPARLTVPVVILATVVQPEREDCQVPTFEGEHPTEAKAAPPLPDAHAEASTTEAPTQNTSIILSMPAEEHGRELERWTHLEGSGSGTVRSNVDCP